MKKLVTILATLSIAVLSSLALVSCGGRTLTKEDAAKADKYHLTPLNADIKNRNIDLFVYKAADPFISGSVVPGFINALANVGFKKLFTLDADSNSSTQNGQVRSAVNTQDVLIVNAAVPQSATGVIDVVKPTKKPLVFFNREMQDDQIKKYDNAWFVGTSRTQPGELQGIFVAEQLINNFGRWDKNGDGIIQYALLMGEAGNPEAIGRTAGSKQVTEEYFKFLYNKLTDEQKNANGLDKYTKRLAANPQAKVIEQLGQDFVANPSWDASSAKNSTKSLMTAAVKPEVIFSNNDGMALGALQALQEEGYNKGLQNGKLDYAKTILLCGVDGLDNAKDAVAKGEMSFTVLQDGALLGAVTTQVAVNLLNKQQAFKGVTEQFQGVFVDPLCNQKIRVPYQPISVNDARKALKKSELNPAILPFTPAESGFHYEVKL